MRWTGLSKISSVQNEAVDGVVVEEEAAVVEGEEAATEAVGLPGDREVPFAAVQLHSNELVAIFCSLLLTTSLSVTTVYSNGVSEMSVV